MDGLIVVEPGERSTAALAHAERAAIGAGAEHLLPLIGAAHLGVTVLIAKQNATGFDLPPRPWLAIMGDDPKPPGASRGPSSFPRQALRQALRQARGGVVVAGEPLADLYFAAAGFALRHKAGVLLVETTALHELVWAELLRRRIRGPLLHGTFNAGTA